MRWKRTNFSSKRRIYSSQNLCDIYLRNTELCHFSFMTLLVLVVPFLYTGLKNKSINNVYLGVLLMCNFTNFLETQILLNIEPGNLNVTVDFQYCWNCRPYSGQVAWEEGWRPYAVNSCYSQYLCSIKSLQTPK